MKFFTLVFGFFYCIFSNACFAQNYTFTQIKSDTATEGYKNIAIIGFGTMENRAFLDILSSKIIDKLKSKRVEAQFEYLGSDMTDTRRKLDSYSIQNFDGILIFFPVDSLTTADSLLDFTRRPAFFDIPMIIPGDIGAGLSQFKMISIPIYKNNRMETHFIIQMFNTNNQLKPIWNAALTIKSDIGKKNLYPKISNEIITSLKKYQVIK